MKIEDSDYIAITDSTVLSVTPEGIHYTGGFISFLECAANYKEAHGDSGNCVGERYADDRPVNFVFYTAPKTTHLYFPSKAESKNCFPEATLTNAFISSTGKSPNWDFPRWI